MAHFGGFQLNAYQDDYQTTLVIPLVIDPDYEVVRPYTYRFCSKTPEDDVVISFNFAMVLQPGESFIGVPTVQVINLFGGDLNPMAILNGSPQVDVTGQVIMVPVIGGLDMNDYVVTPWCATTNDFKGLGWPGILPVRTYPNKIGAP
jgi:hypothetical protein